MGEDEYRECVEQTFANFEQYDRFVEVVSCWEQFLSDKYSSLHDEFLFDRFPTIEPTSGDDFLSPDFSVLFNPEYGVVFFTFHELPRNEAEFEDVLNRLEKYDQNLLFESSSGRVCPDNHDIALLISNENSQTAQYRLNEALTAGDLDLTANLVVLDYRYIDPNVSPKYRFQRLAMVGDNFEDEPLPSHLQISKRFSMDGGGFDSLQLDVFDLHERKATGVLCNKEPNELYLSSYLWQMVFRDQLNDSQEIIWQQNTTSKIIELEIDARELVEDLNENYIPGGHVREEWLQSTLEYLCNAELAERITEQRYKIKYQNLSDKSREYNDLAVDPDGISHLAGLFAEFHCENRVEMQDSDFAKLSEPDSSNEPTQLDEDLTQPEIGDF